jgi:hypothetical protein
MSRKNVHRSLIAVLFVGFLAGSSVTLQAMDLYVYDLDSLVYLSTEVVEGEITRSYKLPTTSMSR